MLLWLLLLVAVAGLSVVVKAKDSVNGKQYSKISVANSVYIRFAYQDLGLRGKKLQAHLKAKGFPEYPLRTLRRHGNKPAFDETEDRRKNNKGRKRKLDDRTCRNLLLNLKKLRDQDDMFCSVQVQEETGIDASVCSNRTVRRRLNEMEYFYLQSRKKGLLEPIDLEKRLAYAKAHVRKPLSFWRTGISFYLDGVGWGHKRNPLDHARTLRTRTWRKRSEGCKRGCTAKGKKEGVGGRMVYFMVAISWGKGVVKAIPYEGPISGEKFAALVRKNFPELKEQSANPYSGLFVQDGDRSQNARVSLGALSDVGLEVFPIPAKSPDFNPIENVFHLISKKIKLDGKALNLSKETYEQFKTRCHETILNFSPAIIDKTIATMPMRMQAAIQGKGRRTKY